MNLAFDLNHMPCEWWTQISVLLASAKKSDLHSLLWNEFRHLLWKSSIRFTYMCHSNDTWADKYHARPNQSSTDFHLPCGWLSACDGTLYNLFYFAPNYAHSSDYLFHAIVLWMSGDLSYANDKNNEKYGHLADCVFFRTGWTEKNRLLENFVHQNVWMSAFGKNT